MRKRQALICPYCPYDTAKSEYGLNIHIGRVHKAQANKHRSARIPFTRTRRHTSTALAITCPECKEGGFKSKAHLGRHRRKDHHIPGREAQRALNKSNQTSLERSPADASSAFSQSEQPQLSSSSTVSSDVVLRAVTQAIAVGSVKELCRNFAEEHGYPTKQFTREFAELFLREAFR